MIEYAKNPPYDDILGYRNETCVGISLQEFKSPYYNYTIFVNNDYLPQVYTSYINPYSKAPDLFTFGQLKILGVLQSLLDSLILKKESKNDDASISYAYLPMHTEEYKISFMSENWHIKVIWLFPLLASSICLGFLVWRLGIDKKVIKESMAFNGISCIWYHIPMFTFFSLFSFLNSLIISVLLKFLCLNNADLVALWFTVFLTLINVYPYALCISSLFENSLALSVSSMILHMAISILLSQYALEATYGTEKNLWSLIPSISCSFCLKNFFGDGSILNDYYEYSIIFGWLFMILDLTLGFLLGLTLDSLTIMMPFDGVDTDIEFRNSKEHLLDVDCEEQSIRKVYVVCGNTCNIYLLNKVIEAMDEFKGKRMAVLFKDGYTLDFLTVKEHFELHIGLEGSNYTKIKQQIEELAEQFNLSLNKKGRDLTQKERKVLYIILLFAKIDNNTLLVFDEPTHGVSAKYHQLVYKLITQKKQQCPILIGTRNEQEAELLADFLLIYSKRSLISEWAAPEKHYIIKTDSIEKVFNWEEKKEMDEVIESTKADFVKGKVREYSIQCKTGFRLLSISSRINTSLSQHVIAPLDYSQKFFSKIWAIFWCTWISTIRDLKVFFFELGAPLMAFGLLFILKSYRPSNDYIYSFNDLPTEMKIPVNYFTMNNKSTEVLFNKIDSRITINYAKYSNMSKIENITSDYNSLIYTQSKGSSIGFLGGYYVADFNQSSIQALVLGNITSPHMPTYFANVLSNLFLNNVKEGLRVSTKIVPSSFYRSTSGQISEFNMKFLFIIITAVAIGVSLISMGYVIAQERTKLLKAFQLTNGLLRYEYWTGKIITDLSKLLILSAILIIAYTILQVDIPFYPIILIGSCFSCLAFFYYLNSFSHKLFTFSFVTLLVHIFIVIPSAIIITMIKLSIILERDNALIWILIDIIARLIPIYNITATLLSSAFNSLMLAEGNIFFNSSLNWHFMGSWVVLSVINFVLYFGLLLLIKDSMLVRSLSKA